MKTMMFNPYTGKPRDPRDIASDPAGILMLDPDEPLRASKLSAQSVSAVQPVAEEEWHAMCHNHPGDHHDLTIDASHYSCIDCGDSWPIPKPSAHPADADAVDAKLLDFMIAESCQMKTVPGANGTRYLLFWPHLNEFQRDMFSCPREAIKAAMENIAAQSTEGAKG